MTELQLKDSYQPVVKFEVQPKIDQTIRSKIDNSLIVNLLGVAADAYLNTKMATNRRKHYQYEFKGDLDDFRLYRDDKLVTDIERGFVLQPLVFSSSTWNESVEADDIAQIGVFTYSIETFRPEKGKFPYITIEIDDLKKKAKVSNKNDNGIYRVHIPLSTIKKYGQIFPLILETPKPILFLRKTFANQVPLKIQCMNYLFLQYFWRLL